MNSNLVETIKATMGIALKDVEHEGLLFSGVDSETSERQWYLVNKGVVLRVNKPVQNIQACAESIVKTQGEINLKKPNIVQVVRYFRRWNKVLNQWESHGGVTGICVMDYSTKKMKVFPAFCSDSDNFEKKKGFEIANVNMSKNVGIEFEFDVNQTIETNLSQSINTDRYKHLSSDQKENKYLDRNFIKAINPIPNCTSAIY